MSTERPSLVGEVSANFALNETLRKNHQTGVHEKSNWGVQWFAENEELHLVEGLAPSGAENQGLSIV
jgi:hypothetical protein